MSIFEEPVFEKPKPIIKEEVNAAEPVKEDLKQTVPETNDVPISLFDSFDDSNLDTRLLKPFDAKISEDQYILSNELTLDVMIAATKDYKNKLLSQWDKLSQLSMHPTYGGKAALLNDGHLLVATNNIMIVEYDLKTKVGKINMVDAQEDLQKIAQLVFNKKMFVYAISRLESVDLQQKYINLKQIGKMPKPNTIEIKMIGE